VIAGFGVQAEDFGVAGAGLQDDATRAGSSGVQIDGDFDGSLARFVASRGQILQQGLPPTSRTCSSTCCPTGSGRVAFQLINDSRYPIYPESVVVRSDRLTQLAPA
jgi:hypothetical protein